MDNVVYIYNGILLSHKKEWNKAICSNMDGPRNYHTYHFYVESKNVMQMNLFTKQKQIYRHKLMVTKGGEKDKLGIWD